MTSRKMKILLATVGAVALIATVAVAHTVRTHMPPAGQSHASKTVVPADIAPSQRHGNITCGAATSASDCERLEMMLPM